MVPPSSYLSNSALKHLHWSCLTPCPCSEPCMCGQRACLILFFVSAASAGGGPVADGGGVRPGSDAEEAGVS